MLEFWDRNGSPIAYLDDDGESIYLWSGTPVGWLSDGGIYSYSGRFLGWFEQGWVRDRQGAGVFFTDDSVGGPVRPVRQVRPVRGVRGLRPVRGVRAIRPIRPTVGLSWSPWSGEEFFEG